MLTDFLVLLGMFVAFAIVCFIADALGLSLFDPASLLSERSDRKVSISCNPKE